MKTIYLILCLFLSVLTASAQGNENEAVVAATNMNVLYSGVSNPVAIAVPGISTEKITATVSNGTIRKVSSGWEIIPGDLDLTLISVLVDGKKVSEKSFRIKSIPVPEAYFAGKNNGVASKDILAKAEELEARLVNFAWDIKFTIVGFRMMYTRDNSDYEMVSENNKLTDKMKSVLSEFRKGDYIVFKDIKALGPDGRTRDLSPIILKIE
jgi:gliding motility-associated protein GldM